MNPDKGPQPLPVYILAGGQSRRFGSDKARALVHGQPMLTRIAQMLEPVSRQTRIVAQRAGAYDDLGWPTIADRHPGLGPLAGIESALLHATEFGERGWVLIAACDLLALRLSWIDLLWERAQQANPPIAVVFAAAGVDGKRHHPFPGLYHTGAAASISECLAADRLGVSDWLVSVGGTCICTPPDWPDPMQANRAQEVRDFEQGY